MSTPTITTHGPVTCLSVTGQGEPGGAEYLSAIGALFTVAGPLGGPAGPLQGLWWAEDDTRPALEVPRELWRWHLLLQPAAPWPTVRSRPPVRRCAPPGRPSTACRWSP